MAPRFLPDLIYYSPLTNSASAGIFVHLFTTISLAPPLQCLVHSSVMQELDSWQVLGFREAKKRQWSCR